MENFDEFVGWLKQQKDRNIAVVGEHTPCVGLGCGYGPSPIATWLDDKNNTLGSKTKLGFQRETSLYYLQWRFTGEWEDLPEVFYQFDRQVDSFTSGGRTGDPQDQRITAEECLTIVEYLSTPSAD